MATLSIEHWRQGWLTVARPDPGPLRAGLTTPQARAAQGTGRSKPCVALENAVPKRRHTSLWSEVADGIDYYFVLGPELDKVIAGYRQLTGQAPMMPSGRLDCGSPGSVTRRHAKRRRAGRVPLAAPSRSTRSCRTGLLAGPDVGLAPVRPAALPRPRQGPRRARLHARVMISVWAKFDTGTTTSSDAAKVGFSTSSILR